MLLTLVALSSCARPPADPAAGGTVSALADGATLVDPEGQLRIDLVEVEASGGPSGAIATAWSRRRPGFDRSELAASDSPGRDGWDLFGWSSYTVAVLVDGSLAAAQRRGSQVRIVHESLRPAGYVRETYRGRALRRLDAARVADLKAFIERVREAADVPGVSVVLFDRDATLIEEGLGVRERGRPEPVTADSLYLIASNTKPLTTLLLARLVDEGRFGWATPVIRIDPRFRIADPEVTRRILLRHLVCACTGLPRQDFATMKPATGFGTLYQYSNPLASAAGYIAARAVRPDGELGQAYDDVMREKVLRPLGMSRTTFSFDEARRADHASPHSWDMTLRNVPIEMALKHSIIPMRPAGGAWSSARLRPVRAPRAGPGPAAGRFDPRQREEPARAARPQVRVGEDAWYGMGLWIEDVKDVRGVSHGGAMFGYKSNFFFAATRETRAFLIGEQRDWAVPPEPTEAKRLAGSYRNAALGDIVVRQSRDEVVFQLGAWKSRMASKRNPDGTTSFVTIDPGVRGFEFAASPSGGVYRRLRLRDSQHTYDYEALDG